MLSPARSDLIAAFRHIKANAEQGVLCGSVCSLFRRIRYESHSNMNLGRLLICLDVFSEFNIFQYDLTKEGEAAIHIMQFQGKADINGSKILGELMDLLKA